MLSDTVLKVPPVPVAGDPEFVENIISYDKAISHVLKLFWKHFSGESGQPVTKKTRDEATKLGECLEQCLPHCLEECTPCTEACRAGDNVLRKIPTLRDEMPESLKPAIALLARRVRVAIKKKRAWEAKLKGKGKPKKRP